MSAPTSQVRASDYARAKRKEAQAQGAALRRMSTSLPYMAATRSPLFVWVDKGRVRTSDGKMRGADIASVVLDTDKDSPNKRTLVIPTVREARTVSKAMNRAKAASVDHLRLVRTARRLIDASLTVPWVSTVVILSRALGEKYWVSEQMNTDDLDAWGRMLGVSAPRSTAGMTTLLDKAIGGSVHRGGLTTRLNSQSEALMRALSYPSPVNDAQAFTVMESIGDLWKTLCAADPQLRPYSLARRRTVAAIPQAPVKPGKTQTAHIPAGSVPFREGSTVLVVDPQDSPDANLHGGKLTSFGYENGVFKIEVLPTAKGHWSFRQAYGREVFLIEEPFGGSPRFSRNSGSVWDQGVPPIEPVERSVPADLSLAGNC